MWAKQKASAKKRSQLGGPPSIPYLFVGPAILFTAVFVIGPLLQTLWLSFFEWDGVSLGKWVGIANYVAALRNPQLLQAFTHSLIFVITFCALPVFLGMVLAAMLSRQKLRGLAAFRTILFLPQVISMVVVGVAWRWMYADNGTVNQLLQLVGIRTTTAWLGDFTWALPFIAIIGTWVMSGLCMVLFLAGIGKIDGELYDAAKVDGAGPIREFLSVTFPGLRQELSVAVTITIIAALRSFDLVYVTTGGGPGTSTIVPGTEIYRLAFRAGEVGAASTIAVLLTLIIFAVVFAITRLLREEQS
ncbi:sugar ABC transporter permease [Glaciihabitans sp. INWT7]|nr:sugar ABC transporter permease [Glaciihabitans sp. INWT7]